MAAASSLFIAAIVLLLVNVLLLLFLIGPVLFTLWQILKKARQVSEKALQLQQKLEDRGQAMHTAMETFPDIVYGVGSPFHLISAFTKRKHSKEE